MSEWDDMLAAAEAEIAGRVHQAAEAFAAELRQQIPRSKRRPPPVIGHTADRIRVAHQGAYAEVNVPHPWQFVEFGRSSGRSSIPPKPVVRRTLAGMRQRLAKIIQGE